METKLALTILNFRLLTTRFPSYLSFTDLLKAAPAGLKFKSTWHHSGKVGHLDLTLWFPPAEWREEPLGRLIQGTAQPQGWCWSQKWFFLARAEVCGPLLGNHCLDHASPVRKQGWAGCPWGRRAHKGEVWVGRSLARTQFQHAAPHQSSALPPCMGHSGLDKDLCFGSPRAGGHWDVCGMVLGTALRSPPCSEDSNSSRTHLTLVCSQYPQQGSWIVPCANECPFLSTGGTTGQRWPVLCRHPTIT